MLKIYLARHGQDLDNANGILNGQRDEPLTEKGIEQAREVAQKIKDINLTFDKIYSSPLQRAFRTAWVIAETLNLPKPEIMDQLTERDFGVMTGQLQSKIREMCSPNILETEKVTYFLSPEGAETFPNLLKRAEGVLGAVQASNKDGNVLLVTHGDFGKMLYAAYYKLNWEDVLKMFHFGNSDLLLLSEDSKPEDVHVFKIKQFNS
jgi:broad specificity phosphatase PhoE